MMTPSTNYPPSELASYEFIFKIVVLGDSGVGKTNLVYRFTKNEFKTDSKATIGVEFAAKTVKVNEEGKMVKAQIWDTAGQERYRSIASSYYRGAVGALLVYDVTDRESFQNLNSWRRELKEHAGKDALIVLVGNKIDLKEKRAVTAKEGKSFARRNGLAFIEASALDATGVSLAFEKVLTQIYENKVAWKKGDDAGAATTSAATGVSGEQPSGGPSAETGNASAAAAAGKDGNSKTLSSSYSLSARRPGIGLPLPGISETGRIAPDTDPDLRKYDPKKRPIMLPVSKQIGNRSRLVKLCLLFLLALIIIVVCLLVQFEPLQGEGVKYVTSAVPLPTAAGEGENKALLDFVHCGTFFDKDSIKNTGGDEEITGSVGEDHHGFEILLLHDTQSTKESWEPVQGRLCKMGGTKASVTAIDLSVTAGAQALRDAHQALINGKVMSGDPVTMVTPLISGNSIVEMIVEAAEIDPSGDITPLATHLKKWVVIGTPLIMNIPKDDLQILTKLGIDTLAVYGSNDSGGKAVHDKLMRVVNAKGVEMKACDKSPQFDKPKMFAKELFHFVQG